MMLGTQVHATTSNNNKSNAGQDLSPRTNSVDIHEGVFNMTVEAMVDLWTVRYGNAWVLGTVVNSDTTYGPMYARLKQLGKVETHYLTDKMFTMIRLSE